tara:strand:- start:925 stop:1677 length:753 start_codon:yes stop_codon:yes gene_type:complete
MTSRFNIASVPVDIKIPPPRLIIYGQPKVGKTSFASGSPSPLLIQTEDGAAGVRIPKIPETPCTTWEELMQCLRVVLKDDHDRKTLILDTLDKAEHLAQAHVLKNSFSGNQEKYMGYYKGPILAGEMISDVLFALDHIRKKRGMNIVLISHDGLQQGANALGDDFKKWAPNLSKYAWNRVRDWADQIGHAQSNFKVIDGKAKELGKDRWIHFLGSPGRDAGCRVGYEMPDKIKLNWDEYQSHMGEQLCQQ